MAPHSSAAGLFVRTFTQSFLFAVFVLFTQPANALWDLTPPDLEEGANFGLAVTHTMPFIAVGAPEEGGQGSVYLYAVDEPKGVFHVRMFERITSPDPTPDGQFGISVDSSLITGGLLVVGEPGGAGTDPDTSEKVEGVGRAHLYRFDEKTNKIEYLESVSPPNARHRAVGTRASVGLSLALSGRTGASKDSRGVVHLFRPPEEGFDGLVPEGVLLAPEGHGGDRFGQSIAQMAEWLVIGAPGLKVGRARGAVLIYERVDDQWQHVQTLSSTNGTDFGCAVSIDIGRKYLVVGAYNHRITPNTGRAGAAYLYAQDEDGKWVERDRVTGPRGYEDSHFGVSVAAGFGAVFVGAFNQLETSGASGMVHAFETQKETDPGLVKAATHRPNTEEPYQAYGISTDAGMMGLVVGATFAPKEGVGDRAFFMIAQEAMLGNTDVVPVDFPKTSAKDASVKAADPEQKTAKADKSEKTSPEHEESEESGFEVPQYWACIAACIALFFVLIAAWRRSFFR